MKKILTINCGSSSLKYEVYVMPEQKSLAKGLVERIGNETGGIEQKSINGSYIVEKKIANHGEGFALALEALCDPDNGVLKSIDEIEAVGHRVAHGGEDYTQSAVIDQTVTANIEKNCELAPLHNPVNLTGIKEAGKLLPNCPQIAVFDTAFHQTLPPAAFLYGLPREFYHKYRIRRYGFHGTSHRYVANQAAEMLKRSLENTNVISCHLGNGASITAIVHGRSVDTSMGFTPLEGLMMGTRSGDLDPAILLYLLNRGFSVDDINAILNKKGGLLGISGISNDMRDITGALEKGNVHAREAVDVYTHRIRKYIGGYAANMTRVDVLIFTGGIGENSVKIRERICRRLENIGMVMDYDLNKKQGSRPGVVSAPYSHTTIAVVPTNEELQIAIDTYSLAFKSQESVKKV